MALDNPVREYSSTADSLQLLIEAAEVVANHPLDLDDLLRALAGLVRKVVDYQLFAVLLADEGGVLSIRYSIGFRPELVKTLRVRPGEGITGEAAEQRKSVVVDDVTRDPRYIAAIDAVRSEMAVPLIARGHLTGVIDLQSSATAAFGERERAILELVASRFSLAIEAAVLYRATVRQNKTLTTLSDIAREFSQILQLEELLQRVCELVHEIIPYDAFSIFLPDADGGTLEHYFGVRFDERVQWRSIAFGAGLVGHAFVDGKAILVDDTEKDDRYLGLIQGIRSEVAVPLMLKDVVIGVLDLESERVGWFTEDNLQTLTLLAPQVAAAIENARLYEQLAADQDRLREDLLAARLVQQSLLPDCCPEYAGIEVAARNLPATEVSGDFYDFFPFEDSIGIWSGDVSGKGAAGALYAAMASGFLRQMNTAGRSPVELLETLNRALLTRKIESRYLAGMYAEWWPAQHRLSVAAAGQPRPIVRVAGKARRLEIGGTPLGILAEGIFDTTDVELASGDVFITASDGLQETENEAEEAYGEGRLLALVERMPEASAGELLSAIFRDAAEFSGQEAPADDRTVIVVRVI